MSLPAELPHSGAAFRVVTPDGHVYAVYANGETEGFGPGRIIINGIPALVRKAFAEGLSRR
jgi:hypothetical protein